SAPERAKVAKHPLGSKQNPVRCFTPAGERRYLERLRCSAGGAPAYERTGQGGIGPYGTALDAIRLTCAASRRARTIYMDMSHRGVVEKRAVPGFAIVPAGEEGGGT
ncbi:MAG: RpoN/RPB10 RNA polymerase subunit family protein, partial [Acidobacteriota bacterium]|nr:RpoN/RPB10 RNA polymerase subunit family protein [Acidobacteriota bacterium]